MSCEFQQALVSNVQADVVPGFNRALAVGAGSENGRGVLWRDGVEASEKAGRVEDR